MDKLDEIKPAKTAIEPHHRHHLLDALRGFALFGILFANIAGFGLWYDLLPEEKMVIVGSQFYDAFMLLLVDGRFYTIFSFLFGLGFALQLSRLQENNRSTARSLYLRRLTILLAIGLVHNFVIWFGDILTLYAILGFVMLSLRNLSNKSVLVLAGLLMFMPVPGYLLFWYAEIAPDLGLYEASSRLLGGDGSISTVLAALKESIQTTELATFFQLNAGLGIARFGYYFDTWRIPKVLAIMLVGMWAGRHLVQGTLFSNKKLFKNVAIWGFAIGLPSSLVYVYLSGLNSFQPHSIEGLFSVVAYTLAVFPTGFAYAAVFALVWNKHAALLQVFAAPGRMALTNYLLQTLLCILIFYGVGFNFGASGAPISYITVAILLFSIQVVFSNLWLKKYKYGPLEWVWRSLTYGQKVTLRLQKKQ